MSFPDILSAGPVVLIIAAIRRMTVFSIYIYICVDTFVWFRTF